MGVYNLITMTEEISLSLSLPKDIHQIIRSKNLSKDIKLLLALELYREEIISLGKAAEIAGITIRDLMYEMKKRNICFTYDEENFENDLNIIGEIV